MSKVSKGIIVPVSFLIYMVIGLIVAFSTPENILERKWALSLVEALSFIPYVKHIGLYGPIPQVAQFFAAIMYICAFLPMVALLMEIEPQFNGLGTKFKFGQFAKHGIVLYVLFPFMVLNAGISAPSSTRLSLAETTSRLGLSLLGSLHVFSAIFLIFGTLVGIYFWRYLAYGELKKAK